MRWNTEAGQQTPSLRARLYGPLWRLFLSRDEHAHRTGADFASAAIRHLTDQGFPHLANLERFYTQNPGAHQLRTFCGAIDLNPHTFRGCEAFFNGTRRLHMGVVSGAPEQGSFGRIFEEMEELWGQSHHVRAVGAYLLEVARASGVLPHVARSMALQVGSGRDEDREVIVLAG
jgi:hypothetical protein